MPDATVFDVIQTALALGYRGEPCEESVLLSLTNEPLPSTFPASTVAFAPCTTCGVLLCVHGPGYLRNLTVRGVAYCRGQRKDH